MKARTPQWFAKGPPAATLEPRVPYDSNRLCYSAVRRGREVQHVQKAPGKNDDPDIVLKELLRLESPSIPDAVFDALARAFPRGPDSRSGTRLLSGLAKQRKSGIALLVLQWLRRQSPGVNGFHYGAAINACEKCGEWDQALELLREMAHDRVEPNTITCSSAISACGKCGEWKKALELLNSLVHDRVESNTITFNAAINACAKSGEWAKALGLFGEMALGRVEMDTVSYNAACSACGKGSQWAIALELLGEMSQSSVIPNTVTYSAAISACEKGEQWLMALELVSEMARKRIELNTITYSSAISACQKAGEWEKALNLLSTMMRGKVGLDTIVYNAAVSACAQGGEWAMALELLNGAALGRVEMDVVSFNSAITACANGGEWTRALGLLGKMAQGRVKMDVVSYNTVISACDKGWQWQRALSVLRLMSEAMLETADVSYSAALSACEKPAAWNCALDLINEMEHRGLGTSGMDYGSMFSALKGAGLWDRALAALERLRASGPPSGKGLTGWSPPNVSAVRSNAQVPQRESRLHLHVLTLGSGAIAVSKPPNITTETVIEQLRLQLADSGHATSLTRVSRLDQQTSGVLVLALGDEGSKVVQAQFAGRLVSKEYLCLCCGEPVGPVGTQGNVTAPLKGPGADRRMFVSPKGQTAHTSYEVLATFTTAPAVAEGEEVFTLVAAKPHTGRMHQIRAHLASIGLPLVADSLYGGLREVKRDWCPRMFLHCRRVALLDLAGDFVAEESLPHDLSNALARLTPLEGRWPEGWAMKQSCGD